MEEEGWRSREERRGGVGRCVREVVSMTTN